MVSKKGQPFTFTQSVKLIRQNYRDMLANDDPLFLTFIVFLQLKFVVYTFLLGALRSVQFGRFNQAGMAACKVNYNHRENGVWKPYQGPLPSCFPPKPNLSPFVANFLT